MMSGMKSRLTSGVLFVAGYKELGNPHVDLTLSRLISRLSALLKEPQVQTFAMLQVAQGHSVQHITTRVSLGKSHRPTLSAQKIDLTSVVPGRVIIQGGS